MDLKRVKRILNTCAALVLIAYVLGLITGWTSVYIICIVLAIGVAVFSLIFWRCPHCEKYLGRSGGAYCPYCGAKLENDVRKR